MWLTYLLCKFQAFHCAFLRRCQQFLLSRLQKEKGHAPAICVRVFSCNPLCAGYVAGYVVYIRHFTLILSNLFINVSYQIRQVQPDNRDKNAQRENPSTQSLRDFLRLTTSPVSVK